MFAQKRTASVRPRPPEPRVGERSELDAGIGQERTDASDLILMGTAGIDVRRVLRLPIEVHERRGPIAVLVAEAEVMLEQLRRIEVADAAVQRLSVDSSERTAGAAKVVATFLQGQVGLPEGIFEAIATPVGEYQPKGRLL